MDVDPQYEAARGGSNRSGNHSRGYEDVDYDVREYETPQQHGDRYSWGDNNDQEEPDHKYEWLHRSKKDGGGGEGGIFFFILSTLLLL